MSSPDPYDRRTIEDAIYDWLSGSSGVAAHWDYQKPPQPQFPFSSMRILSITRIGGEDETRITEDPGAPAGEEIEQALSGPRRLVCSFNFYSTSNDPTSDAALLAARAQSALSLPTYAAALYRAGVSVIDEGAIRDLSELQSETWVSRFQFDVTFGIASNVIEKIGYIETVEVDSPPLGWDPEIFSVSGS